MLNVLSDKSVKQINENISNVLKVWKTIFLPHELESFLKNLQGISPLNGLNISFKKLRLQFRMKHLMHIYCSPRL